MSEEKITRRELIKKAAYVTPVIFTLTVNPSHAQAGSGGTDPVELAPTGKDPLPVS